MNKQYDSIYQSGQQVPAEGRYEVVGRTPRPSEVKAEKSRDVVELDRGELFPNYDGRASCWHLLSRKSYNEQISRREPKPQPEDPSDLAGIVD